MSFRGWPAEAVEFYEGLEADNSKVYWQRHRDTYQSSVRAPMEQLLAELAGEFGPGKLFRPYRDVRFSADKTPYKTNCAATLGMRYVSFSADGLSAGGGLYLPDATALARYRTAVDRERSGTELVAIVDELRKRGYDILAHEVLKTAPRGIVKDHPRIDLLRHKGIATMKSWRPAAWLGTAEAKARIVTALRDAEPLISWLSRNVG